MSAVSRLIAQRQELMDRLEADPAPREREEIQAHLAKIRTALALLESADAAPQD